jgi:UDP-N-acetyl-alpha-D-quinovosamine dehydrogenase
LAEVAPRGRVLVTGSTGFAGRALVPALIDAGWQVRATARRSPPGEMPPGVDYVRTDLASDADLSPLVEGMTAVVHLAARVHVMRESERDPLAEFRAANVEATRRLARAAARAGVRQFVFASTVKVNGEGKGELAYRESDAPEPQDPYGQSKLEAEQALREAATGFMAATILRPPLMYGPGVKGNFARLMRLVARGIPLPLASASNRRSLLFIGNFCSAILASLERPAGRTRLFLVSDGADVSVAELVRRMARALGRPARLLAVPPGLMRVAAAALRRDAELRRLTDSLLVDSSLVRRELQWTPPHSLDDGLLLTARSFGRT